MPRGSRPRGFSVSIDRHLVQAATRGGKRALARRDHDDMRALVMDDGLALRRDYAEPKPGAGESLVRVALAGICGTDLEITRGYMNYRGVPGHEFVGRVVESGNAALRNQRVVGAINAACGSCGVCRTGLGRHCPDRTVLGILGRDGAFAELLTLPDENLLAVPDSLPDEIAVFTEPIAAAYGILERTSIAADHRVCVLGDGRLGATAAMVLKAQRHAVVVGGHHDAKLKHIAGLGIETALEHTLSPGFDVVVDCTGSSGGLARAIELVRPRGTIVLKSTAESPARLNLAPIVVNEINVLGSRCGRFAPALAALASGKFDPRPLISAILPLDDGVRAVELAAIPPNFKILLRVS